MNHRLTFQIGALCLICCFSIFSHNGFLNPDVMEARNIVTAREMLRYDNWLIPTMNGEVRIAKPPLPTWLTSLPIRWFGSDEDLSMLRIPSGIAALLMVFFVYGISKRLTTDPNIPFLAAAVSATSALLMVMGRRASWDIFCHAFMAGAIWAFLSGWEKGGHGRRFFVLAGILMGASFMSKGPIAFHSMLLPFLISYILTAGYRRIGSTWKETLLAIAICVVIGAWWPLYVYFQLPAASLATASTEVGSWFPSHGKSLFYYFQFPVQAGIWTVFCLATLVFPYARKRIDTFGNNYLFIGAWMMLTVFLLTGVAKKSTHYLLPVVVPMALLIGCFMGYLVKAFEQNRNTRADDVWVTLHTVFMAVVAFALPAGLYYFGFRGRGGSLLPFFGYALLFGGIGVGVIRSRMAKKMIPLFGLSILLLSLACWVLPQIAAEALPQRSFMVLKDLRQKKEIDGMAWYSTYPMDPKEIWAVGRRVTALAVIPKGDELSQPLPAALVSKEHPDQFCRSEGWDRFSVRLLNELSDKRSNDTWYVSVIDKNR